MSLIGVCSNDMTALNFDNNSSACFFVVKCLLCLLRRVQSRYIVLI